jgi:hypothetical protein
MRSRLLIRSMALLLVMKVLNEQRWISLLKLKTNIITKG